MCFTRSRVFCVVHHRGSMKQWNGVNNRGYFSLELPSWSVNIRSHCRERRKATLPTLPSLLPGKGNQSNGAAWRQKSVIPSAVLLKKKKTARLSYARIERRCCKYFPRLHNTYKSSHCGTGEYWAKKLFQLLYKSRTSEIRSSHSERAPVNTAITFVVEDCVALSKGKECPIAQTPGLNKYHQLLVAACESALSPK